MATNEKEVLLKIEELIRNSGVLDVVLHDNSEVVSHKLRYDREKGTLKLNNGHPLPIKRENGEWFICEALFSQDGKPKKDLVRGTFFRAYAEDFGDLLDESAKGGLSEKSKYKIRSGARKIESYVYLQIGTSIIKITEEKPKKSGKRGIFEVCFRDGVGLS